jgi:hypothetical protein
VRRDGPLTNLTGEEERLTSELKRSGGIVSIAHCVLTQAFVVQRRGVASLTEE